MPMSRRKLLQSAAAAGMAIASGHWARPTLAAPASGVPAPLKITRLTVTPIALPDPPLLNVGGCHGPYFLRNVVQLETDAGIVGIGETTGGQRVTQALEESKSLVVGQNAFAWRTFRQALEQSN